LKELTELVTTGRWKTRYRVNEDGEVIQKECRSCGVQKTLDQFYQADDCFAKRRSECRDCELEKNRLYHREDKKRTASRKKKWRDANREKSLETFRAWYNKNKDKINERRRELGHLSNKRRRERIANTINSWTKEERDYTLNHFGGCALTGSTENVQFDHVIPLATGHAGTVAWNMLPISAELNLSKSTKHVVDWFLDNKERFNLKEDKFMYALQYLADIGGMDIDYYLLYIDWCHENIKREELN
jgi:hypothetical protein